MKINKKKLLIALSVINSLLIITLLISIFFSFKPLPHNNQMNKAKEFNRNLFYLNKLETKAADPSVIYIDKGEQAGYYYMYATSDEIGTSGFQSWRSKNLTDWECMGVAFLPERTSWASSGYWAPEVICYQSAQDKSNGISGSYYMFYTAHDQVSNLGKLGLAISQNPQGPFVQYTGTNSDGRVITIQDPYIDSGLFTDEKLKDKGCIDSSPFIDDNGDLYMYFVKDYMANDKKSNVWGIKLKDIFTPDYSSAKQLTENWVTTVGGNKKIVEATSRDVSINEGPFMLKVNGRYYLTFSRDFYAKPEYSVGQAVSNSPLGDFRKIEIEKGGNVCSYMGVLGEENYDNTAGTGHHSFLKVGNEIFIFYHAFIDRLSIARQRAVAVDKINIVNNGEEDILYTNGPSYSLQPLPEKTSEYRNLMKNATITATNVLDDSTKYLNDGLYKNHNYDFIGEFKAKDKTKITITFDKEYDVNAIMVYNAFNVENSFDKIDKITVKGTDVKTGNKGNYMIENLAFDSEMHVFTDKNDSSYRVMRPGGSSIAEFSAIKTKIITIEVSKGKKSTGLDISELIVLGK